MTRALPVLLGCAAFAAIPFFADDYHLAMLQTALIAALYAIAFNLLNGQAGMLSFGHAAYFAVGGFGTIHAMRLAESGALWLPTPLIPLAGGLCAGLFGLIAGVFATRRSGVYFSMVTLAIAELLHGIAPIMQETFGGESGLSSMRMPWLSFDYGGPLDVYYTVLAWTLGGIGLLYLYNLTLFGRLTIGLRENERRLSFLGYDTYATKVAVFAVSAAFSGLAGGLLVFANESINYSAFGLGSSASVIVHTFVGGASLFLGPALGALIFSFLGSVLGDLTKNWLLYQGLIFVLIMVFHKDGLGDLLLNLGIRLRRGDWKRLLQPLLQGVGILATALGAIILIELSHTLRSREYLALAGASDTPPAIRLFWLDWPPQSIPTWLLPAALLVAGMALWRWSRRPAATLSASDSETP